MDDAVEAAFCLGGMTILVPVSFPLLACMRYQEACLASNADCGNSALMAVTSSALVAPA